MKRYWHALVAFVVVTFIATAALAKVPNADIAICTNGWVAVGQAQDPNFDPRRLPAGWPHGQNLVMDHRGIWGGCERELESRLAQGLSREAALAQVLPRTSSPNPPPNATEGAASDPRVADSDHAADTVNAPPTDLGQSQTSSANTDAGTPSANDNGTSKDTNHHARTIWVPNWPLIKLIGVILAGATALAGIAGLALYVHSRLDAGELDPEQHASAVEVIRQRDLERRAEEAREQYWRDLEADAANEGLPSDDQPQEEPAPVPVPNNGYRPPRTEIPTPGGGRLRRRY